MFYLQTSPHLAFLLPPLFLFHLNLVCCYIIAKSNGLLAKISIICGDGYFVFFLTIYIGEVKITSSRDLKNSIIQWLVTYVVYQCLQTDIIHTPEKKNHSLTHAITEQQM